MTHILLAKCHRDMSCERALTRRGFSPHYVPDLDAARALIRTGQTFDIVVVGGVYKVGGGRTVSVRAVAQFILELLEGDYAGPIVADSTMYNDELMAAGCTHRSDGALWEAIEDLLVN